jgi:4-amino-4-deoxy-L-arabinose transferase-like glycosyltransferase
MDQILEHPNRVGATRDREDRREGLYPGIIVALFASLIFLGCIISPPSLMDDVDAVQAQIARNMLTSGDWVIARLDGVPYLEKSPLIYWLIAISYHIFGVHDWAARIPVGLAAILLAWIIWRYGRWAFGAVAGFYAGIVLATCVGLFLFTRIQIPDVMLTLCVCMAFWAFQRALDEGEPHPRLWAGLLAASLGVGVLLKGLIAVVAPAGGVLMYLAATRQLFSLAVWKRLHLLTGTLIILVVAAPWHVLATLRMPPYLNFTLHSRPGEYHGFFWFYFINEHVLRFLNLRYPRDYNTVPRLAFWLLHLLWLFPWAAFFPAVIGLSYKPIDRAGRTRLLALCWTAFLLVFFTFSTTQEYYSMPVYPALALLLGSAMASEGRWVPVGTRIVGFIAMLAATAIGSILVAVRHFPTPGDISSALQQHPDAYTLSLGHVGDLTLASFAYLRLPLVVSGIAFLIGASGALLLKGRRAFVTIALMMVLFFHASRLALVKFDPYLGSRPLAEALLNSLPGQLILNGEYYSFSSVFFYTGRSALLLNGRVNNLEYGSYALGSPQVFIAEAQFAELWSKAERCYVLTDASDLSHLTKIVDPANLHKIAESGGKLLLANQPYSRGSPLSLRPREQGKRR